MSRPVEELFDANEFNRNVSEHSAEDLAPYAEQHVAWSLDGRRILAHAADEGALYAEIDRRGITEYVVGFIPNADWSYL
jgi:hypothetical protein